MLAIMNVGKYSSPAIQPSGANVLRVLKDYTASSVVSKFVKTDDIIIALGNNVIYYSDDDGETWGSVSTTYNLFNVVYLDDKFYAIESTADSDLHYGVSDDGITWTWNTIPDTSTSGKYYGHQITLDGADVRFTFAKIIGGTALTYNRFNFGESSSSEMYSYTASSSLITNTFLLKRNSFVICWVTSVSGTNKYGIIASDAGISMISSTASYANMWLLYSSYTACDTFFYADGSTSTSASATARRLCFSQNATSWQDEASALTYADGNKPYAYFKIGNAFYLAFMKNGGNSATWARGASVPEIINIASSEITTVSDVDLPSAVCDIGSKKVLVATKGSHIYLCETP